MEGIVALCISFSFSTAHTFLHSCQNYRPGPSPCSEYGCLATVKKHNVKYAITMRNLGRTLKPKISKPIMDFSMMNCQLIFTLIWAVLSGAVANPCGPNVENKCQNGAVCNEISTGSNTYECSCGADYYGEFCELPTGCKTYTCMNGGFCFMSNSSNSSAVGPACRCAPGFTGDNCESQDACILHDRKCLNNGTCIEVSPHQTSCNCISPYRGDRCEFLDLCTIVKCQNGGKCQNKFNATGYICQCPTGFDGKLCEKPDLCVISDPKCVQNNGVCAISKSTDGALQTYCACNLGYKGEYCQFLSGCKSVNCLNGGSCRNSNSKNTSFECQCIEGFNGTTCEIKTFIPQQSKGCKASTCLNGGSCKSAQGRPYICECPSQYDGQNCETPVPPACQSVKCFNGGSCRTSGPDNSITKCVCPIGYCGQFCQSVDLCTLRDPNCLNNGICVSVDDEDGGVKSGCKCSDAFHGEKCEYRNLCLDDTCKNNGTCKNVQDSFECHCQEGFSGTTCEILDCIFTKFGKECPSGVETRAKSFVYPPCVPELWIHNLGHSNAESSPGEIDKSSVPIYSRRDNITIWAAAHWHWDCLNPHQFIVRSANYDWSLIKIEGQDHSRSLSLADRMAPDLQENVIQFLPWSLPYGTYELHCTVIVTYARNNVLDDVKEIYDSGFFEIIASKPRAVIDGPDLIVITNSETLTLNGRSSYDPDFPDMRLSAFTFTWSCKIENDVNGCPFQKSDGPILYARKFTAGKTYVVTLNVTIQSDGGSRWDSTEKYVKVVSSASRNRRQTTYSYSMGCMENCGKRVVANRKLVYKCTCLKPCGGSEWEIKGLDEWTGEYWNNSTVNDKENDQSTIYIKIEPLLLIELQKRRLNESEDSLSVTCGIKGDSAYIGKRITVYLPLRPVPGESGKKCTVEPRLPGVAFRTHFKIHCPQYGDDELDERNTPIEYAFYYKPSGTLANYYNGSKLNMTGNGYLFYHGTTPSRSKMNMTRRDRHGLQFVLPPGEKSRDGIYPILPIVVEITNGLGNIAVHEIEIQSSPTVQCFQTIPKSAKLELIEMYEGRKQGKGYLQSLTAAGDYTGVLQLIFATLQQLLICGDTIEAKDLTRIKEEMLTAMTQLLPTTVSSFREIELSTNVLYAFVQFVIAKADTAAKCGSVCISHSARLVEFLANQLQLYIRPIEHIERREVRRYKQGYLDDHIIRVARAGIEIAGYLISVIWKQQDLFHHDREERTDSAYRDMIGEDGHVPDIHRDYFLIENLDTNDFLVPLEADELDTIHLQIEDYSNLGERLLLTVRFFGDAIISRQSIVDPPVTISYFQPYPYKEILTMTLELMPSFDLANHTFPHEEVGERNYVRMANDTRVDVEGDDKLVQVLLIVGYFNPFLQPADSLELETPLLLFELKDDYTCITVKPRSVSDHHRFSFQFLNSSNIAERILAAFEDVSYDFAPLKINTKLPKELEPKDIVSHYFSTPSHSRFFIAIHDTKGLALHVTAKKDFRPTCQDYNSSQPKPTNFFSNEKNQAIYRVDSEQTENNSRVGYYFSLWVDPNKLAEMRLPAGVQNHDDFNTMNLNGTFSNFHCISRETILNSIWEESCTVSETIRNMTSPDSKEFRCNCRHLSLVSVTMQRTSKTEHTFMKQEIFQNLDQNSTIPYIVAAFLILYVLLLILVGCMDRHNHGRPTLIVMADIKKIHEETFYLIFVETGNNFWAGTTANACCQLYGEKGRSKEYVLSDKNLDTTRQNGYDSFLVSSVKHLGQLEKIRVWHDNSGPSASWYIRQISVRDIKTDEVWVFFINRWLTVFRDNESVICRKTVATKAEMNEHFENRFTFRRLWSMMREHHMWFSPATCKPRSSFIRSERLTLVFAILFVYMLILISLYGKPTVHSTVEMAEFGVYDWSWKIPIQGMTACVIGASVQAIIAVFFRRIEKKRVPVLLCWDRTGEETEETEVKRRQTKKGRNIYNNKNDSGSESEGENRWANLDPNRVMVVGVPKEPIQAPATLRSTRAPSPPRVFSIPSTDMLATERWISETIENSNGHLSPEDLVAKVEPVKNREPGWKSLVNYGLIAHVKKMRKESPSTFVHESVEPIDDLIAKNMRIDKGDDFEPVADFESKDGVSITPRAPPNLGHGDTDSTSLLKSSSVRDVEVQAQFDKPSRLKPRKAPASAKSNLTKTSIKPFVNPLPFTVELGSVDYAQFDDRRIWFISRKLRWIPWLVCICLILASAIQAIFFGLRYSYIRSLDWCSSLAFAILVSFLIIEPLKVLIIFLATIHLSKKKNWRSAQAMRIYNKLRLIWFTGARKTLNLRPLNYQLYIPKTFHPPLSGYQIFRYKLKVRQKARIGKSLLDFAVTSIFLMLALVANHVSRDITFYETWNTIQDFLLLRNGSHILQNKYAFNNIRVEQDFYTYMDKVFVPNVHLGVDTTGRDLTILRSAAVIPTQSREIVLLGIPRIRQLRVKPSAHNCTSSAPLYPYCNEEYSDSITYSNKDTANYSEGWRPVAEGEERKFVSGNDFWRYHKPEDTGSTDTFGELNDDIDGGGYIAELGRIQIASRGVLGQIQREGWIDSRTRIILVELSLYNPNLNMHTAVKLLLEKSASLHFVTKSQVRSWRFPTPEERGGDDLYLSNASLAFCIAVFTSCLVYFFIFAMLSSIKRFRRIGIRAFKKFVLWVDLGVIGVGATIIWNHYELQERLSAKFAQVRASSNNDYVGFQYEQEMEELHINLLAMICSLGILKMWFFLVTASRRFYIIAFTFSVTGPFILGCMAIFSIILIGYSTAAYMIFGGHIRVYRSLLRSFLTQVQHTALRNIMPYYEIIEVAPIFGSIFYLTFTVCVVLLFMNVLSSVIVLGLQEAKETSLQRPFSFSYHDYIWLKIQIILPSWIRSKLTPSPPPLPLTEEIETTLENVFIPILWNHLNSISVRRIKEMKDLTQVLVAPSDLKLVSKKHKELEKKGKILKIEEGRVHGMQRQCVRYIKDKLKIDFSADDLKNYDQFNFEILRLKCRKLEDKFNELNNCVLRKSIGRKQNESEAPSEHSVSMPGS